MKNQRKSLSLQDRAQLHDAALDTVSGGTTMPRMPPVGPEPFPWGIIIEPPPTGGLPFPTPPGFPYGIPGLG